MPKPAAVGTVRVDSFWGYALVRCIDGKWRRRSRLKMEKKLRRKLRRYEVVHHKNHIRHDDRLRNLELKTDFQHRSEHAKGRKYSEETKRRMSISALRVAENPAERKRRSERAKKQHRQKNFGAWTWKRQP